MNTAATVTDNERNIQITVFQAAEGIYIYELWQDDPGPNKTTSKKSYPTTLGAIRAAYYEYNWQQLNRSTT